MSAEILIVSEERLIKLIEKIYTIGRSIDCDICIRVPSLSRFHASISRDDENNHILCDGDLTTGKPSLNGTRLNGTVLEYKHGRILENGDEITLSPLVSLRFFNIEIEEKDDSTLL